MNKKEIAVFAAWVGLAAVMAASSVYAKDFSVAGQTVSVGASSDLNYTTGVEDWEWELTPSAGLTAMGLGFTMATDIDMLTLDEDDIFQGLDFTIDYTVPSTNISVYTEVSTDSDLEFGDVTVGATVSF
jgi:hypothetical protein